MEELFGKDLPFRHVESGNVYQCHTSNGVTWLRKTGEMVEGRNGLEEGLQAYPWEVFISRFQPTSAETRDFVRFCLSRIVATYEKTIEAILDWMDKSEKLEF